MVDFNIHPIDPTALQNKTTAVSGKPQTAADVSFGQWLEESINAVSRMQKEANTAASKLATGENKDIHGTMISMQKASIAMNLMVEVRNKIISAYDEVKRMQF